MGDFPGVNYRAGLVGDGFSELINVSHVDEDVLRRRPGFVPLTTRNALSGRAAAAFGGGLVIQTASTLASITLPGGAAAGSPQAISGGTGTFARHNGRLYWSNGTAGPYVFDTLGGTPRSPGITAPTGDIGSPTPTGSGGSMTAGAHLFRYRFKNSTTGYVSNASGAASITTAANDSITFTIGTSGTHIIRSAASGVDKIIVEATLAGGAEFYQAAEVNNSDSSVVITDSDLKLAARLSVALYGDDGHGVMPALTLIAEHRGRLFGTTSTLLGWSQPGYPESWDLTLYARKLATSEANDLPTTLISFAGDLYVISKYAMSRFVYASLPDEGVLLAVPTEHGAWNARCVVAVADRLFGFGPNGVWSISAMAPEHTSREVDPYIEDNIDATQSDKFFAWYSVIDRSVTFAFVKTGDSECKVAVTLALRTGAWSTRTYEHGLRLGVNAYGKTYLITDAETWREQSAAFDGVAAATEFTVTAGATTTNIPVLESVSSALVGAYLDIGGVRRLISATGAYSLTTAAFASAPAAGVRAIAGPISVTVQSDWVKKDTLAEVVAPPYLGLEFEPAQATASHTVEIEQDMVESPISWESNALDTPPDGITYVAGDTRVFVQGDGGAGRGFVPVPLPSTWTRTIRFTLTLDAAASPVGLLAASFMPRETLKEMPGVGE